MTIPRLAALSLAMLSATTGCDQDPTQLDPDAPTKAEVAGVYNADGAFAALSFLTADGTLIVDWLGEGARFEISLAANGTSTGELFIPLSDAVDAENYFEPEDINRGFFRADLAGTWSLDDQIIRFEHDDDTFIRDMDFVYNDGTLTGDARFSGVRVQVVLSRG